MQTILKITFDQEKNPYGVQLNLQGDMADQNVTGFGEYEITLEGVLSSNDIVNLNSNNDILDYSYEEIEGE